MKRGFGRAGIAALFVVASIGATVALVSYWRYASVWLRKPPQLAPCAIISRQGLLREEPVTGSIPHVTEKGDTVYLRKGEDRAVRCMDRMNERETAKKLAVAFAEEEPVARARGLVALLRDDVPKDASADRAALATYLFAAAAMRMLPKQDETLAARDELDQLNACRFATMRTPCRTRPPIPLVVWIAGIPSSLVLIVGVGLGFTGLGSRVRAWRRKAKEAKAAAKAAREKPVDEAKPAAG